MTLQELIDQLSILARIDSEDTPVQLMLETEGGGRMLVGMANDAEITCDVVDEGLTVICINGTLQHDI